MTMLRNAVHVNRSEGLLCFKGHLTLDRAKVSQTSPSGATRSQQLHAYSSTQKPSIGFSFFFFFNMQLRPTLYIMDELTCHGKQFKNDASL